MQLLLCWHWLIFSALSLDRFLPSDTPPCLFLFHSVKSLSIASLCIISFVIFLLEAVGLQFYFLLLAAFRLLRKELMGGTGGVKN